MKFKSTQVNEACNYAVRQMVNQGQQCGHTQEGEVIECLYADGEGNHCAIGWLIDRKYDRILPDVQGSIDYLFVKKRDLLPPVVKENREVFTALQHFHDENYKVDRERVARHLKVDYDVDTSGPWWDAWIELGVGE